jgi:tetratricopeptide (TPR) repeat protein
MKYPARLLCALAGAALAGCATAPNRPAPATPAQPAASTASPAPRARLQPLDEARLNEAKMLKEEQRFLEAAAIYEEQSKLQPENADLVARQAHMYSSQARLEKEPTKAKALNKRARELAERAEKLGTDDPLTPFILQSVQPDGSTRGLVEGEFSSHAEADRLIREGEEAFRVNDFAKARECYQRAAELEPKNYLASLWTGDAYFNARQLEPACEWFRRTISIDPDNETAHRYLADALAKLGRKDEAMNEYIAALLCEPYQRLTRQHFTAQLRAVAEAKGRKIPRFPAGRFHVDVSKKEIGIDSQADNIEAVYALACANWRIEKFAQRYAHEENLRRSLPEEIAGLELLLVTGQACSEKENQESDAVMRAEHERWKPTIASLATLKAEGLLEAYALFERVDADLAKEYATYRAEHRDKLERYIRADWCGFE